jgi:putative transposase
MRQLNGVFTQAFNRRYQRSGHLFQGRFKAILIDKDSHLLEASRYIVLNAVRAGVVEKPADWPWSSYRATAGMKRPHPSLREEWILRQFGRDRGKAEREYRRFVQEGLGKEKIWAEVKGQILLGGAAFVDRLREHLRKHQELPEIPKSQRFVDRLELEKIFLRGSSGTK